MAIQILPQENNFGGQLGSGLGQGLQVLLQHKLQDMHQQKQLDRDSGFWKSLGFPSEISRQIAGAHPSVQKSFLDRLEGLQIPTGNQSGMEGLQTLMGQQVNQQPSIDDLISREQGFSPQEMEAALQGESAQKQPVAQQQSKSLTLGANPRERMHREALEEKRITREKSLEDKKISREEKKKERIQDHIDKKFQPLVDEINKESKGATEDLRRLDAMEQLVEKGDLSNPLIAAGLETLAHGIFGIGVDLFSLTSDDTQKFRKIQKDFVRNAKEVFGSRVTQGEVNTLLQTIPSLSQSDSAKLEVIDLLKPMAKAKQARKQAYDEIMAEYDYINPKNLDSLISKREDELKNVYAEQFKKNIEQRSKRIRGNTKTNVLTSALPGLKDFGII